jgi:hypothetical protein
MVMIVLNSSSIYKTLFFGEILQTSIGQGVIPLSSENPTVSGRTLVPHSRIVQSDRRALPLVGDVSG